MEERGVGVCGSTGTAYWGNVRKPIVSQAISSGVRSRIRALNVGVAIEDVDLLHPQCAQADKTSPFGHVAPPARSGEPLLLRPHSCLTAPPPFYLKNILTAA